MFQSSHKKKVMLDDDSSNETNGEVIYYYNMTSGMIDYSFFIVLFCFICLEKSKHDMDIAAINDGENIYIYIYNGTSFFDFVVF